METMTKLRMKREIPVIHLWGLKFDVELHFNGRWSRKKLIDDVHSVLCDYLKVNKIMSARVENYGGKLPWQTRGANVMPMAAPIPVCWQIILNVSPKRRSVRPRRLHVGHAKGITKSWKQMGMSSFLNKNILFRSSSLLVRFWRNGQSMEIFSWVQDLKNGRNRFEESVWESACDHCSSINHWTAWWRTLFEWGRSRKILLPFSKSTPQMFDQLPYSFHVLDSPSWWSFDMFWMDSKSSWAFRGHLDQFRPWSFLTLEMALKDGVSQEPDEGSEDKGER